MCIATIIFLSLFFVIPLFFCFINILDSVLEKDIECIVFGIILLLFFSISSILGAIAVYSYEVVNLL